MRIITRIITLLLALLLPSIALAAPTVSSVSGNASGGQQITITGSGFGTSGPNVILFDDFSGSPGSQISKSAAVGSWSSTNLYPPVYIGDENGNVSALLVDGSTSRQLQLNFDPVREIFLSYRTRIPSGYRFPGADAVSTFPSGSRWKLAWIMDGPDGYSGNDDICIPSWSDGVQFTESGNGTQYKAYVGRPGTTTNWFSFKGWNRVSNYMKGGNNPSVDQGVFWFQGMSEEFGQKLTISTPVLFDSTGASNDGIYRWSRLNFPGWISGNSQSRAIYDDIYFAIGPNARARIEIGNAATYAASTNLALLTPDKWSSTSITATVRQGGFASGSKAYLYVFDANGNMNSNGYPITLGISSTGDGGGSDPVPQIPLAPENLRIQ